MGSDPDGGSSAVTGSPVRRWWPWIAAGVAVLVGAAVAVGVRAFRDTATPVPLPVAVDRFRTAVPTPTAIAPAPPTATPLPRRPRLADPGVYAYRTSGGEEVDALGGTRHAYPVETTITVRHEGCGAVFLWTALEERFEEWALCLDDGQWVMPWFTAFHRFFGNDDRQDYTCEPALVLLPQPTGTGACRADDLTERFDIAVVSTGPLEVGDELVPATHLHIEIDLTGDSRGSSIIDLWLEPDTGLPLRWAETVTSTTGSFIGDVRYDEVFEVVLTSMEPSA